MANGVCEGLLERCLMNQSVSSFRFEISVVYTCAN